MLNVDFFRIFVLFPAGDADIAAAHGLHPEGTGFFTLPQGKKVQGVGMAVRQSFFRKDDFRGQGRKHLPEHPVRAVAYAGFAQGAVKNDPKGIRLWVLTQEKLRGPFRSHGMGAGGPFSNFINVSDRLHRSNLRI